MAEVSIAMATYNGAKYLKEQLESLYSQTKTPAEVVVCDDCSTDDTCKILEEYHQKKGLIYFVNEVNLGVNKNFEKAIRLCSNPYIAICDQDDIWYPQKIEVLLNKMIEVEDNKPCVVSSKSTPFYNSEIKQLYENEKNSVGVAATLLRTGNVQGCTLMLNRRMVDLLKPFPKSYKDVMMYDCYISFVAASCGIKYNVGQVLMAYRYHDSNVLAKIQKRKSLGARVAAKMRYLKYDRMFPSSRCITLKYIFEEYEDVMLDDAKCIIKKIYDYCSSGLLKRMKVITLLDGYSRSEKIFHLLVELLMSVFPVKNTCKF